MGKCLLEVCPRSLAHMAMGQNARAGHGHASTEALERYGELQLDGLLLPQLRRTTGGVEPGFIP